MSNYGDQLSPPIVESLLKKAGCDLPVTHFAIVAGNLADGRPVRPLAELVSAAPALVIVGGGDLIRTDSKSVAMDHLCIESARRRWPAARIQARGFARRSFLPGDGPWLPLAGWGSGDSPVLYASVGVHDLPDTGPVRAALAGVSHAWVRTRKAQDRLALVGLEAARSVVAPDAVFTLRDYVDLEEVQARGRVLLRQATGSDDATLIFHAAPFTGWDAARATSALRRMDGYSVATLALGEYAGEDQTLGVAARAANKHDLGILPADDVTAVMAAAGCVVSTSMHAAIVCACVGTPVIVPGVEKTQSALAACPEPPNVFDADDASLIDTIEAIIGTSVPLSTESNAVAARSAFDLGLNRCLALMDAS